VVLLGTTTLIVEGMGCVSIPRIRNRIGGGPLSLKGFPSKLLISGAGATAVIYPGSEMDPSSPEALFPYSHRPFWVQFIVALFLGVIGLGAIGTCRDRSYLPVGAVWALSLLLLLIITNRTKDRGLLAALLVVSVLWALELSNREGGPLPQLCGVVVVAGGLWLLSRSRQQRSSSTIGLCLVYLLFWLGLTAYRMSV
jgi:hypothetical protein